jgi:hypothetical protein
VQIDDMDSAAVGARSPDAGITIDRYVAQAMIRRDRDFMAVDVDSSFADQLPGIRVKDESGVVLLISDEKVSPSAGGRRPRQQRAAEIGSG